MKLITEADFRDYEVIHDKKSKDRPPAIKLKGVYIQCNQKNGNGRIYDFNMMKPEVDAYIKDYVEQGRALGELEHPEVPDIRPDQAAVRILSLKENPEEKNWIGESIVLASFPEYGIKGTPKGDIAASLINYGTKLGFSTRGLGDVNESTNEVTEFHLCTIDLVSNPSIGMFCDSNGNRCVNGILESKDFMINTHGAICEKAYDSLDRKLRKLPVKRTDKEIKIANAVHDFFNSLI